MDFILFGAVMTLNKKLRKSNIRYKSFNFWTKTFTPQPQDPEDPIFLDVTAQLFTNIFHEVSTSIFSAISRNCCMCMQLSYLTYDTTQSRRSVQKVLDQYNAFHLHCYPKDGGTRTIHNVSTLLLKEKASCSGTHLYTRHRKSIKL